MPTQFNTIPSSNEEVNRVQQNIRAAMDPLSKDVLLNRTTLSEITVTTAGLTVQHSLGRTPKGWIVVDQNADARIWRTAWTSTTISLDSSATVKVTILLF